MALPLGAPRIASEKQLDLNIEFTDVTTWCACVHTGLSIHPKAPHVAPTIKAYPGDTARISLHNKLPLIRVAPRTSRSHAGPSD